MSIYVQSTLLQHGIIGYGLNSDDQFYRTTTGTILSSSQTAIPVYAQSSNAHVYIAGTIAS